MPASVRNFNLGQPFKSTVWQLKLGSEQSLNRQMQHFDLNVKSNRETMGRGWIICKISAFSPIWSLELVL